ncbi:hypothetical protein D3C74_441070 [compost metagenome]
MLVNLIGSRNNLRLNRQYHGLKDRPVVGIRSINNNARTRKTGLLCVTAISLDMTCGYLRMTGFCWDSGICNSTSLLEVASTDTPTADSDCVGIGKHKAWKTHKMIMIV